MVNNRKHIEPLLVFPNKDCFYFVQVLQRKKDNPELGNNSRLIKAYYIRSIEQLENQWEEMTKLAILFNARVSINLNPRNFVKAAFHTLQKIANQMSNGEFDHIYKVYNSVCGEYHSEIDKRWILDVDKDDLNKVDKIKQYVNLAHLTMSDHKTAGNYKVLAEIPTKTGLHIITNPFNKAKFAEAFPTIDVQCNNPTLLFYELPR